VVALARLDVLPEDGPVRTETCWSFNGIFNILMCVKSFRVVKILEQKTRVQIFGLISSISCFIARYYNGKKWTFEFKLEQS